MLWKTRPIVFQFRWRQKYQPLMIALENQKMARSALRLVEHHQLR